jgi:hypothetical protein
MMYFPYRLPTYMEQGRLRHIGLGFQPQVDESCGIPFSTECIIGYDKDQHRIYS